MHRLSLPLIFLVCVATYAQLDTSGCPPCIESRCPKNDKQCLTELVTDLCGCCPNGVCAKVEGDECYNATLIPPPPLETKKYGLCGKHLNCIYKSHFSNWDMPHASCVCDDTRMVCSTANETFTSICDMKLQAKKNGFAPHEVNVKNYGPCIAIPEIVNGPKEKTASSSENIIFSCEARGYPIPVITWEFAPLYESTRPKLLPGDTTHIAVQSRGGPDNFMATGWVQIMRARQSDAGIYTCVATNKLGHTKISARLTVIDVKDEV